MIVEILLKILIAAYALTGIIVVLGYLPTIRDLYNKKKSANTPSYIIWTLSASITFMYALFIIKDLLLIIVTGLNFTGCTTVLLMSVNLSLRNKTK